MSNKNEDQKDFKCDHEYMVVTEEIVEVYLKNSKTPFKFRRYIYYNRSDSGVWSMIINNELIPVSGAENYKLEFMWNSALENAGRVQTAALF